MKNFAFFELLPLFSVFFLQFIFYLQKTCFFCFSFALVRFTLSRIIIFGSPESSFRKERSAFLTMVSVVVGGAAAFTCAATLGRTSATTNTAACCSSSSGGGGFLGKCSLGKFPPGRGQRTTTGKKELTHGHISKEISCEWGTSHTSKFRTSTIRS